ncbi:MAG: segregation/condensation protein A [Deltaproteobacteria bacterium]|nr:segregation/condensation protein A [Deltaproteobacteria bacterium]MBW2150855.1 segregation/condensation protein A [Deltaproteobacteria bacterium]
MSEFAVNEPQQSLSTRYEVKLSDIFEGPMDLLIHLIKKNEVNIYDIPIALITRQYLEYLEWMKQLNIDLVGDFLVMASTLTQIKSRMLLPSPGELEDDQEDPRMEIARPLLEYLQIKSAAEQLAQRNILGDHTFSRQAHDDDFSTVNEDQLINVGLFELIDAFRSILDALPGEEHVDFTADRISVTDRISQIVDILEEKGSVTFTDLFSGQADKSDIIVTFLAILEMVKLYLIRIVQHVHTGIIRIFYI